jgi:acetyl esterase/lipase
MKALISQAIAELAPASCSKVSKDDRRRFMLRKSRMLMIALTISTLIITGFGGSNQRTPSADAPIILWPSGAPGAVGQEPEDVPTLTAYLPPKEKATGAAMIVCPGGGYSHLSEREGRPVAEWLSSVGVAAFVLRYRLGPRYHHPAPFQDAARAIRLLRSKATEWQLDPNRIGILGFSAGGHVASTLGTHFDAGQPGAADPIARFSSRPDLMILIYPVISMREITHAGSKELLIGKDASPELVALLSNDEQVTKTTPPTFLVHSASDPGVPVENSLRFAAALKKAGVPFDLNIYERGPHGFGLAQDDPVLSTWPRRCEVWLSLHGFIKGGT